MYFTWSACILRGLNVRRICTKYWYLRVIIRENKFSSLRTLIIYNRRKQKAKLNDDDDDKQQWTQQQQQQQPHTMRG